MKHDQLIGLTLAEGARRNCDSRIVEALAAAEAEAARLEALDQVPGRQDSRRGMLKAGAYCDAEHHRCQLLDDLRRRLECGELMATARERPTGPRVGVAASAWQYLHPHFADDTARDGLGAAVLFQVRIVDAAQAPASPADPAAPAAPAVIGEPTPVYTLQTLRGWYLLRRSACACGGATGRPPHP
jgi:hypothetical protein